MNYRILSLLLLIVSPFFFLTGCKSSGAQPTNPFAQNLQTVPPPNTFSSQEWYLGQVPGAFSPQMPATNFPPPNVQSPATPSTPQSNTNNTSEGATRFQTNANAASSESESGWTPVEMAATSQTAFQVMEAKGNPETSGSIGFSTGEPESLVVGTSHVVTTIVDSSQPASMQPAIQPVLSEPGILYSGKYTE